MSKQEFLDKLRAALNNSLAPSIVADIGSEMKRGKSEQQVLASLGDPRLIARTIVEANSADEDGGAAGPGSYEDYGNRYDSSYGNTGYGYGGYQEARNGNFGEVSKHYRIPGWVWALVVILVLVVVIGAVMSVLSFLAPILVPIVLVLFLVKLFRDWLN